MAVGRPGRPVRHSFGNFGLRNHDSTVDPLAHGGSIVSETISTNDRRWGSRGPEIAQNQPSISPRTRSVSPYRRPIPIAQILDDEQHSAASFACAPRNRLQVLTWDARELQGRRR